MTNTAEQVESFGKLAVAGGFGVPRRGLWRQWQGLGIDIGALGGQDGQERRVVAEVRALFAVVG